MSTGKGVSLCSMIQQNSFIVGGGNLGEEAICSLFEMVESKAYALFECRSWLKMAGKSESHGVGKHLLGLSSPSCNPKISSYFENLSQLPNNDWMSRGLGTESVTG
jgi:hypothetical protein